MSSWYALKSQRLSLDVRGALKTKGLTFFLPTETVSRQIGNKRVRLEQPIALNLLFIHAEKKEIDEFLFDEPYFKLSFVYSRHSTHSRGDYEMGKPIVIPDDQMQLFIRAVGQYADAKIPYVKPDEAMLQEGDMVRIIGGPFDGIEGTLLTTQGKKGGQVLVSINSVLAVPTLHIEPEYLQVLKFGKGKKHFYKQMDAYCKHLNQLRGLLIVKDADLQPVRIFVGRFSALITETNASQLRLLSVLYASYKLLGDTGKAHSVLDEIKRQDLLNLVTERNRIAAEELLDMEG